MRSRSFQVAVQCVCLGALLSGYAAFGISRPKAKKHTARASQAPKAVGAAGLIAVAQHQFDTGSYAAAVDSANLASSKAPILEDYAQYIRAQAEYRLRNFGEITKSVTRIFNQTPVSPLIGAAAALAVNADLDHDNPKEALELIKKYAERIPEPSATLLLARCFAATGDLPQAAEYYQRVYYEFPSSKEATDAANALVDIKQKLGDAYPPIMPAAMLDRAKKLFQEGNPAGARIELAAAIPQLAGAERDLARVRLGEADYLNNSTDAAFQYLTALKVDDPEADAERLNYLVRCVRRLDRKGNVKPFLEQFEQQHPNSPWRLETLIDIADQARVDNDPQTYLPLYRACSESFPKDPRAGWCHWRVAFDSYRKDSSDAYDLLRSQIQLYPDSPDVNDALYFLGRLSEKRGDFDSARACYDELVARFPNTYFAVVTRERLNDPRIQAATAKPAMTEFLHSIAWPPRPEFPSFTPGKTAQFRIDRANLLETAGVVDLAEGELKFGAREDGEQENLYAYELAKCAARHSEPYQAMHYIKAFAPGYLYMPLDEAPVDFWQLAFPIPYRQSIQQYSHAQGLDPFLVAALIRQESEFKPNVISHANAYGLMQLLPATGRQLARHFGVRRLSAGALLVPTRNIQLGTYFFHSLLTSYGGQVEVALASYNAGPGRANLWRTWGPYREPAEFIETVPFHETRGYIQIVLRNADVYRRLYSGSVPDVPAYHAKPAPKPKPRAKRKSTHRAWRSI